MKIAIRAEGSSDIGILKCDGSLQKGPMLVLIEKLDCFKAYLNTCDFNEGLNQDDYIEWIYIHKKDIEESSEKRKKTVLRGKKKYRKEGIDSDLLKGFYNNSEGFAYIAKEKEADIAIFFVDTDNDFAEDRHNQVNAGLSVYGYKETGIPMIPTKISEAWLMCCLSQYQNCANHENATTDKTSNLYPKKVCDASGSTTQEIAENCDPNRIDMPSFNRFRDDFKVAVNTYIYGTCE